MATATARHILVESEDECNQIKTQIDEGSSFEAMPKTILNVLPVNVVATWVLLVRVRW
jgi:hypothetical protein